MQLSFTKMQGAGNDYIYLDCRATGLPAGVPGWSQKLSARHFSVGADGIICICPPTLPGGDATMRMFNADGSEGKMCGNGVRCVAEFLYTHGLPHDTLQIDTAAGRKVLQRLRPGYWQADMGRFSAMAADVPAVGLGAGPLCRVPLTVAGTSWEVSCISMGNPHCVVVWPADSGAPLPTGGALAEIGPAFEHAAAFPEGINTEFVQQQSPTSLVMRVWERGSGETLACGTGACATVAAMVLRGACPRDTPVEVHLLGGVLSITVKPEDTVWMAGPAAVAFTGQAEV
ncbi:MAG: diaminopimelate epimerase [Gemmiger sp.]|nr:diaminopimelate epimerase [Gemmiger sp.]